MYYDFNSKTRLGISGKSSHFILGHDYNDRESEIVLRRQVRKDVSFRLKVFNRKAYGESGMGVEGSWQIYF